MYLILFMVIFILFVANLQYFNQKGKFPVIKLTINKKGLNLLLSPL